MTPSSPPVAAALARLRRRLVYNEVFKRRGGKGRYLLLGAMGAAFMAADYFFFRRILIYFDQLPISVGEILIIQLLNTLCLTLFSMLLFSNVIASISTLYLSRDLDFLISSPVGVKTLFVSRLIATAVNSSWMALIFGLPIFIAYGQTYYAVGWYYVAILGLMIPFLLIPAAVGTTATMALMRFFPARRTYQVFSFVGLVFIGGLVMFFRFLQPEKYLKADVPEEVVVAFVDKLKTPDVWWLPSSLMARGLQGGAMSDWAVYADRFVWLGGAALAAVGLAVAVAALIYLPGWSATHGARENLMPSRERIFYRTFRRLVAGLDHDTRAILMKDVKLFWRETGQWSQLFMLGALVVVYIFNIRNLPLETLYLTNVVSVMNIGLAGVVLAAVAARFAFGTTSVEGKSFWVVHTSPIDFSRFLWAKFFLYLAPLLVLAEILVVVSNYFLNVAPYVMTVSALTVGAVTVGLTAMGVGMGALFPKFDYENVAQIGVTSGAILYMIGALVYTGLSVALIARPVHAHLLLLFRGIDQTGSWEWIHYGGVAALTAVATFAPMRLGTAALRRMES
jgi:ABC-2 type transport system permease protein